MKISVPLSNQLLPDRYSKYAPENLQYNNRPSCSFPISITDKPVGTESFALTLIDHDAIPVCGFTWIHWVAANIPGITQEVPENASVSGEIPMLQGNNSNRSNFVGEKDPLSYQRYVGPQPPDQTHLYTLKVYALDTILLLNNGFWLNTLYHEMTTHILAETSLEIPARA